MTYTLGISAYYHDSAAALLCGDRIVAACQEERLSRKKHDSAFPSQAIGYCLKEAGISLDDVRYVVFYDKPLLKFERLLQTYLQIAPSGLGSFIKAMPVWAKEKVFLKQVIAEELGKFRKELKSPSSFELLFGEHHESHAAAAFYPSPFREAAVLCMDGVGEWATTSAWHGMGSQLRKVWEIHFPHSLGLLYSAFTYYCGFKVNSGEYKLMGLAPYGEPKYVQKILDHLIDVKPDGSFALDMSYFGYVSGLKMTNSRFHNLFGRPPREAESELEPFHMDVARSIQVVTEEIVLRVARGLRREVDSENLCLAGGVALNCVANGKLYKEQIFKNIWVQPAAGDAGSALGAAYLAYYNYFGNERHVCAGTSLDAMQGAYLGPRNQESDIVKAFKKFGATYEHLTEAEMIRRTAQALADGHVVGWCQGRMEFGPRALGARSILADPRHSDMQTKLNLKIKFRESFRPFAPAIRAEDVGQYFEFDSVSPYMLMVAPVQERYKLALPEHYDSLFGIDKLKVPRSTLPSITHVDYSARLQTVHKETNPRFYELLDRFADLTGCPILVNTSFNVRGEPIVESAEDAYRCFMRTGMDYLVVENFLLEKSKQPTWHETQDWRREFALD